LIIPEGSGCTRGAGLPGHGEWYNDFTTTAPIAERSMYGANSAACPAVPDAVITGWASVTDPMRTGSTTDARRRRRLI